MSMTIIEFLEARIAEDEKLAQDVLGRAAPDPWDNPMETGNFWPEEVRFLDHHSPARVLAECSAKRVLLDTYQAIAANNNREGSIAWHEERALLTSVRIVAAVYRNHGDYQAVWLP